MSFPERRKEDWQRVYISIMQAYFDKETEKAYCFLLWGRKRIAIPKSLLQDLCYTDESFECSMPLWYIREHNLKSLVHNDQKYLFPTKKEQLDAERRALQPTFFETPEPVVKKPVIQVDHTFDDEF